MDSNDLIKIILNISKSLAPLQQLLSGLAYVLGLLFVIGSLFKLHGIVASSHRSGGESNTFVPLAYFLSGVALLFLPTVLSVFSVTVFGSENILQYTPFTSVDITSSTIFLVQTAGLIWFIRGCVLLAGASQPGVQEGPKGMVFLCAGILALNFHGTFATINTLFNYAVTVTLKVKSGLGF